MSEGRAMLILRAALLAVVLSLASGVAAAQDRRQNQPGQFDFYVLSLSWSPSFCQASAARPPNRPPDPTQCGARPFSFVVHGLRRRYERGFPEFCQEPPPRLDRNIVSSISARMPAPRLI